MEEFKKLLGEKKAIDPIEKEAKLNAIKGMKKMAGDMVADEIKGMKKVTVAAPDSESLKAGLEKAEEVVESEEMTEESEDESEDVDAVVAACETPEQIDELMKKLEEKKAALVMG